MNRILTLCLLLASYSAWAADYVPQDYVWTTPSHNSSESMPCGGHDIGMNVWVEQGDVLFYAAQSGWFDENNTLLKAGRWRLHLEGHPLGGPGFEQRLCLDEGALYIRDGGVELRLWADVEQPVVFLALTAQRAERATLSYESWRYRDRVVTKAECQQCSYKWLIPKDCTTFADSIRATGSHLSVLHRNRMETVFDFTVSREHMDAVKDSLYNPLAGREMGLEMEAPGFTFCGTSDGIYASTDYRAWHFRNDRLKRATVSISLSSQSSKLKSLRSAKGRLQSKNSHLSSLNSSRWWHQYWQRSWIRTDSPNDSCRTMVRNYELMRYLLGCNARGQWPTKFNGGLFTFDPVYVDSAATFTPDYRKWGGGTMTAQNQRLVYWPMLKSGDTDLLRSQLDTYLRLLPNAEAWTRHHWGHGGACFSEQLENFGLPNPAEYGKHPEGSDLGTDRNAWLEYEWDTVLEFCYMAQQAHSYAGMDLSPYAPLIASCLRFFDEHYQLLARQRGAKPLDGDGRLIIYPGSGCETYKMAYNPSSTIAALRAVAGFPGNSGLSGSSGDAGFLHRLPAIPLRTIGGDTCIAPAVAWARIQNVETPQLYPVFPWRIYGLGRPGLDIARNTYQKDPHALEMRSSKGWKQDNIWAACLGLTDEALRLTQEKLADGPYRFPAFWEPGFDWAPDHNRGGSAMTGLQEMLLQETPDGQLLLFPAWPRWWDVSFRLCATGGRTVEASLRHGEVIDEFK